MVVNMKQNLLMRAMLSAMDMVGLDRTAVVDSAARYISFLDGRRKRGGAGSVMMGTASVPLPLSKGCEDGRHSRDLRVQQSSLRAVVSEASAKKAWTCLGTCCMFLIVEYALTSLPRVNIPHTILPSFS